MGWAARRRFFILLIVGSVVVAFLAVVLISAFTKTPSCSDGIQNQNEEGIDCGGSCSYLCINLQRPPTVLFTKTISNGAGRTDVVASVENSNVTSAAKNVPYTVTIYGANQVFVQEVTGTLDLPPSSIVPIFISGISSGNQKVTNAFLTIASSSPQWFTMTSDSRVRPVVTNAILGGSESVPRIDAVLGNAGIVTLTDVPVIVFVHNNQGEIIAASKTIVPTIPAQGQATATFTWNSAFRNVPAKIEVIPVISLP